MKPATAPAAPSAGIDFKKCLPVPQFQPDVVAFVGHLIAHDSHHRGQIAMLARQGGPALPTKIGFGLWEWGALWRESGPVK